MRAPRRLLVLCLAAVLAAGCSGIPGSGDVHDVTKVANPVSEQAPATPEPGMRPDAIVRGFIAASARISVAGTAGSAYQVPSKYLTTKAQQTWQRKAEGVAILSDQYRVDPNPTDPSVITISGTSEGTLDRDKSYHSGNGSTYRVTVHLVQEGGQWRITDPPAELLILESDFRNVFAARTVYFLDATRTVVVPDRRYLIKASNKPENRVESLINLLIQGPAGVLKGAALSELTGGSLRTTVTTEPDGVTTKIDLLGVNLPTPADKNALVAQIVWTLYPDPSQLAISIDGVPLDPRTPTYTLSTVQSFNPDRVPGTGAVAADPYVIEARGAIIDLRTRSPLYGPVGTGSAHVQSAAMSAANGTLAAVSNIVGPKRGQALLIGQPLNSQATQRALEATTLTQPSFSRSGDEVWVVQNGASKNPEVYQVSTSLTSATGTAGGTTASRAKVGVAQLAGKGPVTALTLSPDGVRVAIVAGGKLYLAAIAAPAVTTRATTNPATPQPPEALALINLQELRGELDQVGPVAFRSSNQILAVSKSPNLSYRSIVDMPIDGSDARAVTSSDLTADVQSMAVSNVGSDAGIPDGSGDNTDTNTGTLYVSVGLPNQPGTILQLQGSLSTGQWVSVDPLVSSGVNPFFPS